MKKKHMLGVTVTLALALTAPVEARLNPGSNACADPIDLSADERTVCVRFSEMAEAARALDADAVLDFFQPEGFSAVLAGEVYSGFAPWSRLYRDSLGPVARIDRMEFPDVELRTISADTIILINTYDEEITLDDGTRLELTGFGSQTWVRRDGDWRIIHVAGQ